MSSWDFYFDKWAEEASINRSILTSIKEKFIMFAEEYNFTTKLSESFQSILFKNKEKFSGDSFSLVITFIVWFYNYKDLKLNHFQINDLIKRTEGTSFVSGKRSDPMFLWAYYYDITLDSWINSFSVFLDLQKKSYNIYRQAFNNFLDYLIFYPDITRNVSKFAMIDYTPIKDFKEYAITIKNLPPNGTGLRNNLSKLHEFFEWFLLIHCTTNNIIDAKYKNPIEKISLKSKASVESHRNALPTRYIKMLKTIITENDYTWPKTLKNEWIEYDGKKVWSPVTTYLLLLKLTTPIRTHQLRYLDSGEGDKYYFNYDSWSWEENKNYLYEDSKEFKGVLKKIIDRNTQKELVGLYINTNKTHNNNEEEKGYIIPWENKEIIKIIYDLIKWQKKYNPINKPLKWIEINDVQLKKKSNETLKELGENFFLFRDMFNKNPQEPILDSRVQYYWKMLVAELERRVNYERSLRKEKPIKFIEKWIGKKPTVSYYDLHSLRVSLLTALHQSGVPYSILSKYLAGHSTIIMTMYYVKYNQNHISETLNKATKEMTLKEQQSFNSFLANANYKELEENLAYNDDVAIDVVTQLNNKSCITSDIGICPVGEAKCSEGGEFLSKQGSKSFYSSIENGPKNCLRCRFFITGVPFLLGLTSRFNELAVEIKEKTKMYTKVQNDFENLYNERYLKEKNSKPFLRWKDFEIADSNFDRQTNELNQLLIDWQYLYNLIEQCQIIQKRQRKDNSRNFSLITKENIYELNTSIKECSEFEIYDEICQSSVFYNSIQPNISNMKRNQIINKMLLENDLTPYFMFLDEEESLHVANQFVKLLIIKLGKLNAIDIFNTKKKLKDFGLNIDIKDEIEALIANKKVLRIKNEK